jgi:putative tricarboxylic transport membrane protein
VPEDAPPAGPRDADRSAARASGSEDSGDNWRRGLVGPRVLAFAIVALGGVLLVESLRIGQTRGYSPVGPSIFPLAVSIGLITLGAVFAARLLWRPDEGYAREVASEEAASHWPTVGLLLAAMAAYAILLRPLGYPLATAGFFAFAARTLGSSALLRDLVLGLVVGMVIWFGFTQILGVALPAGLLDPILPGA